MDKFTVSKKMKLKRQIKSCYLTKKEKIILIEPFDKDDCTIRVLILAGSNVKEFIFEDDNAGRLWIVNIFYLGRRCVNGGK